tara:strand:- start:1640 stop:1861 length:222 start_codon:yes stop_codon:yes gene_type:complete
VEENIETPLVDELIPAQCEAARIDKDHSLGFAEQLLCDFWILAADWISFYAPNDNPRRTVRKHRSTAKDPHFG